MSNRAAGRTCRAEPIQAATMVVRSYAFSVSVALPTRNLRHLRERLPLATRCCASDATAAKPATAISWNVNSMRSLLRKNPRAIQDLVDQYDPDVLCLQETKLQQAHEDIFANILDGFETVVFNSSTARLGYSGTAIYAKRNCPLMQRSIGDDVGDREGRLIMLEFPGVQLVNVYTMNAGTAFKRLSHRLNWDSSFRKHLRHLHSQGKPIVVLGDLNVARHEHDVHDPNSARKLPGFSDEERGSFEDTLETCGMVDAFRLLYPDVRDRYTYWDYRSKARERNRGWRIDYALVSDNMTDAVRDVKILDHVHGSDHCPIAITLAPGML